LADPPPTAATVHRDRARAALNATSLNPPNLFHNRDRSVRHGVATGRRRHSVRHKESQYQHNRMVRRAAFVDQTSGTPPADTVIAYWLTGPVVTHVGFRG
jgi:aryl-alcohol dehydrogenase-like predicted oxidoreductase